MDMIPSSYFTAAVDAQGTIYTYEANAQRTIGVTTKVLDSIKAQRDSALAKAEEYYSLCVEHGVIHPEPTQDEVLKQALKEIKESRALNEKLMEKLNALSVPLTKEKIMEGKL